MGHQQTLNNHELFLQAFEKPTQIYRLLGMRNAISPIFLHRTLSYMKDRMSRNHKRREDFKVDKLLATVQNKYRTDLQNCKDLYSYLTLMFIGFYSKTMFDEQFVKIDMFISNISHKKRGYLSSPQMVQIGSAIVKANPVDHIGEIPAISIPTDCMKSCEYGGCILVLKFTAIPNVSNKDNIEEPTIAENTSRFISETEMHIFDKRNRCILFDGDYEITLPSIKKPATARNESPKKRTSWEELPQTDGVDDFGHIDCFDNFGKLPTLKFRLSWTKEKSSNMVDRPLPITICSDQHSNKQSHLDGSDDKSLANGSHENNNKTAFVKLYDIASKIIYRFIYNNNSSQQTEACDNFNCPWCNLNCIALYSLLKHLKFCHPRFNFTYVPTEKSVRIDVTINELFDGSYSGSPLDLAGPLRSFFGKMGSTRRTPVTHIIVCHPRRCRPSLTEFLEIDENEANAQRPYIAGHNRLYYHSTTYTPVLPKEFDSDSEDEHDPVWLRNKTVNMIDDFSDVNDGEKELMKMWNLHIMHYNFVGDVQIPLACEKFLEDHGKELLEKNLCKNFVLHLCNLYDYGLLSPQMFVGVVLKMRSTLCSNTEGRSVFAKAYNDHLQTWLKQQSDLKLKENRPKQPLNGFSRSDAKKTSLVGRPSIVGRSSIVTSTPNARGRTRSSLSPKKLFSTMAGTSKRVSVKTSLVREQHAAVKFPIPRKRNHTVVAVEKSIAMSTRRRRTIQNVQEFDRKSNEIKVPRVTRNGNHPHSRYSSNH